MIELLRHSWLMANYSHELTRLEYLSDYIFDFTTYDGAMSELFASKAVEVCNAISRKETFDYIKDEENYKWYLLMCNMPFFAERLEWGTSIRGAWWRLHQTLESCGIYRDEEQVLKVEFDPEQWEYFIQALIEFSRETD